MRSEKAKMLGGERYDPLDPQLAASGVAPGYSSRRSMTPATTSRRSVRGSSGH